MSTNYLGPVSPRGTHTPCRKIACRSFAIPPLGPQSAPTAIATSQYACPRVQQCSSFALRTQSPEPVVMSQITDQRRILWRKALRLSTLELKATPRTDRPPGQPDAVSSNPMVTACWLTAHHASTLAPVFLFRLTPLVGNATVAPGGSVPIGANRKRQRDGACMLSTSGSGVAKAGYFRLWNR